jgi:tRNA A37 methylthiotransferase MiaB
MNPNLAKDIIKPLIGLLKDSRIYGFLHIPVQSGSNKILADMNRGYTNSDFIELVKTLRKSIDDITISTDIIVGYPTETESDFQETLRLLKKTKPEIVNISRYTPRPHTLAAMIKPLPQEVVTSRLRKVVALCRKIRVETNKLLLNKKLHGLIVEKSSRGNYVARTNNYWRAIINSDEKLLGKEVLFRVDGFTERYLQGSLL